MDYQKFTQELPKLYENWGEDFLQPKATKFAEVLDKIEGMTTVNIMQLLNFAVECLEDEEIYCEVGCYQGATLIGALLDNHDRYAYAVDNFAEFDREGQNLDKLAANLAKFELEERVFFCDRDFEGFFFDLREIDPNIKIGVYLYDGAHDYRSQMLGLFLAKSFLAPRALIIVDDSNLSCVKQANWDFMAAHPQCQLLLDLPTARNRHRSFWNGIQVLSWDVNRVENNCDWESFRANFREPQLVKAIYDLHFDFELNTKLKAVKNLYTEADRLIKANNLAAAEQKYLEALKWQVNNACLWHDLGMVYYQQSQYQKALDAVIKSIKLDGTEALSHYSMGLIQQELGKKRTAALAYKQAIALDPQMENAYNNLGLLLTSENLLNEAEIVYRQAISINPDRFSFYGNLGNVLIEQSKFAEAVESYQKALELEPNNPEIINKLETAKRLEENPAAADLFFGNLACRKSQYKPAIAYYEKYQENSRELDLNFYFDLAFCYQEINQKDKAIETLKAAINKYPDVVKLHLNLISNLQEGGRTKEAIAAADRAVEYFPNNLTVKLEHQRLLPVIYNNLAEIDWYRDRFVKYLDEIIATTNLDSEAAKKDALIAIANNTNFFLQYQVKKDLELQQKYGNFVHKIMAANYPQWVKPPERPTVKPGEKLRIGYISSCFYYHTISKLFLGWFKNHDKEKFEIYSYYPNNTVDGITDRIKLYSDFFRHIPISSGKTIDKIEAISQQILADRLHILVFIDLGIYPASNLLAGLKLAPIQCQTWAHPITSGIPTVDYFLSSELMEPENGQEHYAETLINLPNLGFCYSKPEPPSAIKQRSDLQLKQDAIIYLCCQSTFKYLPQYDYIFAAIAKQVPQAQFAFLSSPIGARVSEQFRTRLQIAFAKYDLDSKDYCQILPRLNFPDYLSLNLVSDIFLDSLGWSGGNTTLEAIACNLPIVTCPGEFMRGRHSAGILQMIGITETIANSEAEYIDIAVRLGLDSNWRKTLVERIKRNHDKLYEDLTCVRALEQFYQRAVKEY